MEVAEFCGWVRSLRDAIITRRDFCKKYPWHENTIKAYDKDRLPEVDYLYAIHRETGYSFNELLRQRLSVGILEVSPAELDIVLNGERSAVRSGTELVINCEDDSMQPVIFKDAKLTIDRTTTSLKEGRIFAMKIGGRIRVRRIQFGLNNEIMLLADNPSYKPITVSEKDALRLNVVGQVIRTENSLA